MTREADVEAAIGLGASYVGVVFAGGPRALSVDRARQVLRQVPPSTRRVGVFGHLTGDLHLAEVAAEVGLDVVQLHGDPDAGAIAQVRERFCGTVWAALRVPGKALPAHARELFALADAVVLDAYASGSLGGTGLALPWEHLADAVAAVRAPGRVVLAGGLRPETVSAAVHALHPDVVDVSSGVESAPGIKDHAKLRAFREAVWEGRTAR